MRRLLKALLLATALALPVTGCAAVLPAVTQILNVVTDALVVLNIIDNAVNEYFDNAPLTPPRVKRQYLELYRKALAALAAAQHALEGVEDLDQQEYDKAFQEFRDAYAELRELLRREGLMRENYLQTAKGEMVLVPEPQALTYKVH